MYTGNIPPTLIRAALNVIGALESETLFKTGEVVEGKVVKVLSATMTLTELDEIHRLTGELIVGKARG